LAKFQSPEPTISFGIGEGSTVLINETYEPNLLEGKTAFSTFISFFENGTITDMNASLVWNGTNYNTIKTDYGNGVKYFYIELTKPVKETSKNVTWYWNWTFFNATTKAILQVTNTSWKNQTVWKMYVDNCKQGVTTTRAIVLNVRDLTNSSLINSTVSSSFTLTKDTVSENYIISLTNTTSYYCISPTWLNQPKSLTISYNNSLYGNNMVSNYVDSADISNATRTIDVYLTNETGSALTTFQVLGDTGSALAGVTIEISKYVSGSWISINQISTDYDGKASAYLTPISTLYKFIVKSGSVTLGDFGGTYITCSSGYTCPPYFITLSLSSSTLIDWFEWYNYITVSCANSTTTLLCSIDDPNGKATSFNLLVDRIDIATPVSICDVNGYSSSIILSCDLGNSTDKKYNYRVYGTLTTGSRVLMDQGSLDYTVGIIQWGEWGIFIAICLNLIFYPMAVWWHPIISEIAMVFVNYIMYIFNILPVSALGFGGFIVVNSIVIFLISKVTD
jgi:hypothetical protein